MRKKQSSHFGNIFMADGLESKKDILQIMSCINDRVVTVAIQYDY